VSSPASFPVFFEYYSDFEPKTGNPNTPYPTIKAPYLTIMLSNTPMYSFLFMMPSLCFTNFWVGKGYLEDVVDSCFFPFVSSEKSYFFSMVDKIGV
jgi:hypothetical protein